MNFRYLTISQTPSNELLELLNNNVIGTPGYSMLYQHRHVNEKLGKIENPYFINLERSGHIAGTCCFCKRVTANNGNRITSFYVRYFSFKDIFRKKAGSAKATNRNSALRDEVNELLKGPGLGVSPTEEFFHYAYVDPRNERSAILCREFGFEPIRKYASLIFSRLNPQLSERVEEAKSNSMVTEMLNSYYHGFNMLSYENFAGRKYYVIRNDQGQVVAGALVNPDQWKIHALPGWSGKFVLKLFTYTPLLNRLINRDFRFITVEGVYCARGAETYLEKLLESLLAQYHVFSAICVADVESPLYVLMKSIRLGLVSKLKKEVQGDVIVRFQNITEEEKNVFKKCPVYISGIDAT